MAFVSQTPWVQNMTFRDNVTYMSPNAPSAALYRTAVHVQACGLEADVASLDAGHDTQIGRH